MLELLKRARVAGGHRASLGLERACSDPVKTQRSVLLRLISSNAATAFGRAHDFSSIRTEADFRHRVPVREYEDFRPYINRIIAGERRVLTSEEPFMLTMTSGTTHEPKYIPVTPKLQSQTAALMSLWLYRAELDHRGLLDYASAGIVGRAVEGHTGAGLPYGSASGLIYKNIPWLVRRAYAVPYLVSELDDYDERYLVAARFALSRRVSLIATPNPSTLIRLASVTADNQERLVRAMRDGTLGTKGTGQREIHARLASGLRPDPTRAAELERVIRVRGFLRFADCWPDLRLIGCWTGGSVGLKVSDLSRFYGDVPVRDLGYMASEGRITIPFEDGTPAGIPSLATSYYEFIAEEEQDSANPCVRSIDELEDGGRYSVLLTTLGGLYRYQINDIVEVTGYHGRTPLLSFVRKGGEMANITGEKMHVNHFITAIKEVACRFHLHVEQFRIAPDFVSCRYEIYLELERAVDKARLRDEVLPALERALAEVNMEYDEKRCSKRLAPLRIHLMKSGWAGRAMRRDILAGRRDTQYKWQILAEAMREGDIKEIESTIDGLQKPESVSPVSTPPAEAFAA